MVADDLPHQEHYCCIDNCCIALVWDFSVKVLAKLIEKLNFNQNNNKITVQSCTPTPSNWMRLCSRIKAPAAAFPKSFASNYVDGGRSSWMWCRGWSVHNIDGVNNDGVCTHSLWSGENVLGGVGFVWPLVWEEWPWRRWFRGQQRRNWVLGYSRGEVLCEYLTLGYWGGGKRSLIGSSFWVPPTAYKSLILH